MLFLLCFLLCFLPLIVLLVFVVDEVFCAKTAPPPQRNVRPRAATMIFFIFFGVSLDSFLRKHFVLSACIVAKNQ